MWSTELRVEEEEVWRVREPSCDSVEWEEEECRGEAGKWKWLSVFCLNGDSEGASDRQPEQGGGHNIY